MKDAKLVIRLKARKEHILQLKNCIDGGMKGIVNKYNID